MGVYLVATLQDEVAILNLKKIKKIKNKIKKKNLDNSRL